MRIPTHIQRSRHGIYFFRMVVPKALRETFDGQTEIKRSLHTRNLREAMRMARPLSLQAYELFAHLEASVSRSEPIVADILLKDQAGKLRELRATKTITLPDGTKHSYDIQTDSNDPAEIAAFERQVERERADLREAEARYREKPVELPQGMQVFQQKQSVEMAEFKATLAAERSARERAEARLGMQALTVQQPPTQTPSVQTGVDEQEEEDAPSFKFNPKNVISLRWAEYVGQNGSVNWTAEKTPEANQRLFAEFFEWWGKDDDIRAITRKRMNEFITYESRSRVAIIYRRIPYGCHSGHRRAYRFDSALAG